MGTRSKIMLGGLVLVLGIVAWWFFGAERRPLSERQVAMRALGERLRKTLKPRKVLLISNPFSEMNGRPAEVYSFQRASEVGLKEGLGEGVEVKVVFPKLRPEAVNDPGSVYVDPKTKTPLSFLIAEDAFETLLKENADCEVAVSLIGLPLNATQRDFWKGNSPKMALLLPDFRMIGSVEAVRGSFASGKIAAAVIARPGAVPNDAGEFESQFVLVTAENIEALAPILLN